MTVKTSADRQRALRVRRQKAGHIRREYWGTKNQHSKLKKLLKELQGETVN